MPVSKITLSAEDQTKLVKRLKDMIAAADEFHSNWEQLHKIYWQQYFCQPDSETRTWPWRGASNLFLPLGRVIQDGIMSQLHDAMFANDPVVKVQASRSSFMQKSDILSRFYGDYVFKKVIPLRKIGNDWNFMSLIDGTGVVRARWDRSQRLKRTIDVELEPVYGEAQKTQMLGMTAFAPPPVLSVQERIVEDIAVERAEQPVLEVMDLSRLRISPDTVGSLQYPDCPWYYTIADLTWQQLLSRKREGYEGVDEALKSRLGQRSPEEAERMRRDNQETSEGSVLDTTECYEFYMRLTLPAEYRDGDQIKSQSFDDESGFEEEVVVSYFPATATIARIIPLYRIRPDGKRPDIVNHYAGGIPFRFYGMGVQAKMRHLNAAMNSGANQMVDYGTLQNMPFYFYIPHLAQMPDLTSITPGQGIPVGDTRGINFPRMNGDMSFWFMLNQFLQGYAERDGTITDQTIGRMPEKSANKTFRGMALVQQMANIQFRRVASLMSEAYKEAMYSVHNLYRRYAPPEIVFRVTGDQGAEFRELRMNRSELDKEVSFEMVLNPDRQNETQTAMALFELVTKIPYVAQNPQSVRMAAKHLYDTIGYGSGRRDFNEIWPEGMVPSIATPQQPGQAPGQPPMPGQGRVLPMPQRPMAPQMTGRPMMPLPSVLPRPQAPALIRADETEQDMGVELA